MKYAWFGGKVNRKLIKALLKLRKKRKKEGQR